MLVSLTVGKVDAGVTVLLTPDKRLIEFPSILLPPNIVSGSIVDITVSRNYDSEAEADKRFAALQDQIFKSFGASEPTTPNLRCRNATQTSVVLEWDPIELATADLISLSLYRNGQKAGNIPRPLHMHSTKISGLAVDTKYTFHLVLRTSAGTLTSKQVVVSTHKMTDLSGVTITTGVLPGPMRDSLAKAVERIGAKLVEGVRIDTTHFVTTEGRGTAWEKAVEMNIPVVRPEWVEACERTGRILGVTKFYLDAVRHSPQTPVEERPKKEPSPPLPPKQQPATSSATESGKESTDGGESSDREKSKTEDAASTVNDDDEDDDDDKSRTERPQKTEQSVATAEDQEKAAQAAQNSRREGEDKKNRNLPLRPVPSVDEEHSDQKPSSVTSPGDRASFQDVAL